MIFFVGKRSDNMPFVIEDSVEILAGPGAGNFAAVISPERRIEVLCYLVEPGDGSGDLIVSAKNLSLLSQN